MSKAVLALGEALCRPLLPCVSHGPGLCRPRAQAALRHGLPGASCLSLRTPRGTRVLTEQTGLSRENQGLLIGTLCRVAAEAGRGIGGRPGVRA